MVVGYVLVKTEMKREKDVYQTLLKEEMIQELELLAGEFDIIAKIVSEDHNELGNFIINKIRSVDGVKRTVTFAAGYKFIKE